MPNIYMNEEGKQVAQSPLGHPLIERQDHTTEYHSTDVVVQGSKGSVIKTVCYTFVFSQALQDKREAREEAERIAEENARLDKSAKRKMRRYLNKTFDNRVATLAKSFKKSKVAALRDEALLYGIDTKMKKAELTIAIATVIQKERDELRYALTTRNTDMEYEMMRDEQ